MSLLQPLDVELDHFQHCFDNALGARPIRIFHHIAEHRGCDLPEELITVFQPPTLLDLSAFRQRRPEPVNFGLIVALNHERYGMIKRVKWSRAEGHERLPHQCELDHLHRTSRALAKPKARVSQSRAAGTSRSVLTVDFGLAIPFSPDPMIVLHLIYAQKKLVDVSALKTMRETRDG
jgi:hypothetical protein